MTKDEPGHTMNNHEVRLRTKQHQVSNKAVQFDCSFRPIEWPRSQCVSVAMQSIDIRTIVYDAMMLFGSTKMNANGKWQGFRCYKKDKRLEFCTVSVWTSPLVCSRFHPNNHLSRTKLISALHSIRSDFFKRIRSIFLLLFFAEQWFLIFDLNVLHGFYAIYSVILRNRIPIQNDKIECS